MYSKLFIFLIYISFFASLINSAEINTGIVYPHRGTEVIKISDFFGIDDGYTNNDEFPRAICDVDGNGHKDIVGFHTDGVKVSFNDGSTFEDPIIISTEFRAANGYNDM